MRSFVTGGTGLIGRHLVARLLERGDRVHVLVRPSSVASRAPILRSWERIGPGEVIVVEGDLTEPTLSIPADIDHAYHLAALYDLSASEDALEKVNVEGTRHLLDALRATAFAGVLHYVSSVAVAGDYKREFTESMFDERQKHPHAYHRTKFAAEGLVRAAGDVRWRIYRPSAGGGALRVGGDRRCRRPLLPVRPDSPSGRDRAILKRLIPGRLI